MDPDLIFVIGLLVGFLAFPALLSAYSSARAPRAAAIMLMISAGLIVVAIMQRPEGTYTLENTPDIFAKVVRDLAN